MPQNTQEIHLKVLRHLEDNPEVSQRQLAEELGISLGKANYCLKALINKGLIKASNFKNNANKRAYLYVLTPNQTSPNCFQHGCAPKIIIRSDNRCVRKY